MGKCGLVFGKPRFLVATILKSVKLFSNAWVTYARHDINDWKVFFWGVLSAIDGRNLAPVGSLSQYLLFCFNIPGGFFAGFLNHQQ